jgi:adenylate kinase
MIMKSDEKSLYNTVLLFGAPGSGKGTWGKILGMVPGFYHLSTGEMFRMLDTESELGMKVMEHIRKGELVEDNIAFDLWQRHMSNAIFTGRFRPHKDTLVLDGFPRTPRQAEMLKSTAQVKAIILLDCADRELLIARLHKRAVLELRADDANEQIIRHRFDIYDRQIQNNIAQFPHNLVEKIDVSAPPINILASVGAALDKHLMPARASM